jgi:hypothetical protein
VGNAGLYFYPDEPHRRPHVDVTGPDWNVTIALDTLEVLARSGRVPPRSPKDVIGLLRANQMLAIDAFHATLEHRFPGNLGEEEGRP